MSNEDIVIEEVVSPQAKEDFKLKIVVVGDSGVGKTNLIKRFISNEFSGNLKATIGVEFMSKTYRINKHLFKIEIWDTAGQERYKSITAIYYKGSKGALIVYDTTNQTTFENIDKWILELKEKTSNDIKLMIVGNKIDLKDERQVKNEDALKKADTLGIPLMETSALEATNVKEAFYDLLKEIYKDMKDKLNNSENKSQNDKKGIDLNTNDNNGKKKSLCC
jgi:Ras-related protein Rab-11A